MPLNHHPNHCHGHPIIILSSLVGVTLLNKAAFSSIDFRYPYFLSAVHMALNALGANFVFWSLERKQKTGEAATQNSWITQLLGNIQRQSLDKKGKQLILAFSFIFSLKYDHDNKIRHARISRNNDSRYCILLCITALPLETCHSSM